VPRDWVVPALGLGTTIGLVAAGIALTVVVRRALGRAALAGLSRATLAGLAGGVAGAAAGGGVALSLRVHGIVPNAAVTVLAAAAATVAFLAMTLLTDGGDLRAVTARLLSRLGRGRPPAGEPGEAGETR
jgi:putative peptidoglycan lipid II flippase